MTICVTVIAGVSVTFFVQNQILREVEQELNREADTGAHRIALYLDSIHHNLDSLATSSLIVNGIVDTYGRDNYLVPFLQGFRISDSLPTDVGLFDYNGKVIGRSSQDVPADISQTEGFSAALSGDIRVEYVHPANSRKSYITISYPVFYPASQSVEGVLLGRIHLVELPGELSRRDGAPFFFKLTDIDGEKVGNWVWPDHQKVLEHSYDVDLKAPLNQLGLKFHVARVTNEALSPVRRLVSNIVVFAVLFVVITTLVAVFVGRQLSNPLRLLERTASRIAKDGYFDVELPHLGNDEVGRLASSFREMLGHINVSYSVLEARVTSRTRELDEAQLRLRDSANQLQSILDNVVDTIVTVDTYGRIQSCNNTGQELFKCSVDQVLGKNIIDFIDVRDLEVFLVPTSDQFNRDQQRIMKEAVLYPVHGDAVPIEYAVGERMEIEGKRLMTLLIRDITKRKEVEKLKEEFISSVSHELRTPLTSITGALSLAKRDAVVPQSERLQKLLDVALDNSRRLGDLVNDILDLEKLENGKISFTLEDLDLGVLVQKSIDAFAPYVRKHGKEVRAVPPTQSFEVLGDAGRLMQVMNNLLSNAAKYSGENSRIDVVVAAIGSTVRVSVIDQGPGIPSSLREHMFSRFWQADGSNTKKASGTGLGLAITKSLMEGNGGTIGYRSRADVGSIFYIDLPIKQVGDLQHVPEKSVIAVGPCDGQTLLEMKQKTNTLENTELFAISRPAQAVLYLESGAFSKKVHVLPSDGEQDSPTDRIQDLLTEKNNGSLKYDLHWLSTKND
ncbi:ATP-binding protein [Thalassospira lucentensis]|uniref:ATP-binding protein n=1 Tax=Thalassospira lucentensis TaxID=168935 RepID=UPI003D2ECB4F